VPRNRRHHKSVHQKRETEGVGMRNHLALLIPGLLCVVAGYSIAVQHELESSHLRTGVGRDSLAALRPLRISVTSESMR
jgi:hypothetical protein